MLPPLAQLRRVGLFVRDESQKYPITQLSRLFSRSGVEMVELGAQGINRIKVEDIPLDLIISLGGDGTVIQALKQYPEIPTLAINYGNIGFLTQCDEPDLEKVLFRLLSDDYFIEERLTIEATIQGQQYRAINEITIKGIAHMTEVEVSVDQMPLKSIRGDGVIVGTPTGSTAYLMSAGSPIVTPGVSCIVLQPLNEYSFGSRAMILPGDSSITLCLRDGRANDVVIVIDGDTRLPFEVGELVTIHRAKTPARLVALDPAYFFKNLHERLPR